MLTERQAFKVAFLTKCADAGMTMEETLAEVAATSKKLAADAGALGLALGALKSTASDGLRPLWDTAKGVVTTAKPWAIGAALGAPFLAGGALGYGAAHLTDINDDDPDEAKTRELIDELHRHTQQSQMAAAAARYRRQNRGRSGRPLL